MTEKTVRAVRFWYGIFLSVFTVVVGVLFLAGVADIYFNPADGQIFTREIVWEHLFPVLIPFCLWIVAVIAGFVLSVVMPYEPKRKRKPDAAVAYAKLKKRIPAGEGDAYLENYQRVRRAEVTRFAVWCASALVCLVGAIYSLVYLFDSSHFSTTDYNGEVLTAAKHVQPCIAAAFASLIAAAVTERITAKQALPYVKKLVAAGGAPLKTRECVFAARCASVYAKQEGKIVLGVRIAVGLLAIVFVALGIVNGGAGDVLVKAINICTECIGLG